MAILDITLEMYDLYINQKLSSVEIGKLYNMKPSTIISRFTRAGFDVRSNKENSRKYSCNHNYFDNINTEDKAYWLGFLYADGFVTNDNRVGISIKSDDIDLLIAFNESISSNYKINIYTTSQGFSNNTEYARLLISSKQIVESLVSHGMFYKKSNILKRPNIEADLTRHFIRGYLDGDGSIFLNNSKSLFYSVSFVGTDDILSYICEYFLSIKAIKNYRLEKRNDEQVVSYVRFGGNIIVKKILDDIYKESTLYLKRKNNIYMQLNELVNSRLN